MGIILKEDGVKWTRKTLNEGDIRMTHSMVDTPFPELYRPATPDEIEEVKAREEAERQQLEIEP